MLLMCNCERLLHSYIDGENKSNAKMTGHLDEIYIYHS